MSRVILVSCDLLLPDLEAYTLAISGIVQQWQGELRPQALSQTLDFIGQEWFDILRDAEATTAKLVWLKSFIQFPARYPTQFTPRQIDFSEQDLLRLEVQEAERLQVPLVCFEAGKYEALCRQLGSRVYVVDIDNLPLLALHHQLQFSSHSSFSPTTTPHHPDPVENLPVPTVENELPIIDAPTSTLEFEEEVAVNGADPTPRLRSPQTETNLQVEEQPIYQLDSEGRVRPTLNRSIPPADTLPLLIFFLLAKLLPHRLTHDSHLDNLAKQNIESLSQILSVDLAAIVNQVGVGVLELLQPSLVLQPVAAATVSNGPTNVPITAASTPVEPSLEQQVSPLAAEIANTSSVDSNPEGPDIQVLDNTGWLDAAVDLVATENPIDQVAQLSEVQRLQPNRLPNQNQGPADNRSEINGPGESSRIPDTRGVDPARPLRPPLRRGLLEPTPPPQPSQPLRPPTPVPSVPFVPNQPPSDPPSVPGNPIDETPNGPPIPPTNGGVEPSDPDQGNPPSEPKSPDGTDAGEAPAQPPEAPTELANPVGNTSIAIEAGKFTIRNFGGVGRGVTPSADVVRNLDTLKFSGSGLTPENLLLNQRGNDLVITFESVSKLEITLKDFRIDNLDNLTTATWASITIGNILFEAQDRIEDSFDVIDAERAIEQVLRPDTVTFLNLLDNQTQGRENSNDVIDGLEGNDRLFGLSGDDKLRGSSGNDELYGGSGNDYLLGGIGDDLLDGGSGRNVLNGGAGRDRFLLSPDLDPGSVIEDFQLGTDRIQLTGGITSSQVTTQIDGDNTLLLVNNQPLITLLGVQISNPGLLFG